MLREGSLIKLGPICRAIYLRPAYHALTPNDGEWFDYCPCEVLLVIERIDEQIRVLSPSLLLGWLKVDCYEIEVLLGFDWTETAERDFRFAARLVT